MTEVNQLKFILTFLDIIIDQFKTKKNTFPLHLKSEDGNKCSVSDTGTTTLVQMNALLCTSLKRNLCSNKTTFFTSLQLP